MKSVLVSAGAPKDNEREFLFKTRCRYWQPFWLLTGWVAVVVFLAGGG